MNELNNDRATVLIVDDEQINLAVLRNCLSDKYVVKEAMSGEEALRQAVSSPRPDIILLDIMMPGMDGYEVISRLKADDLTQDIPVLFVTALSDEIDEVRGFELGAADFITKPIKISVVQARVKTQLGIKAVNDYLNTENDWLDTEIGRRMTENALIQDLSTIALASLAECRDNETGHHIIRTQAYVELLVRHLGEHPRFKGLLAGQFAKMIIRAAPLHDIGKVGIPDAILLKPGQLDDAERKIMETHSQLGANTIRKSIEGTLTTATQESLLYAKQALRFMRVAEEIALTHHEHWDGSGYPGGLAGEAIPVGGRIMALADVYDALTSKRIYKKPLDLNVAAEEIIAGRGTRFDPDIVDAFVALRTRFEEIAKRFNDGE